MIFTGEDSNHEAPAPTALFSAAAAYCEANLWTAINGWSVARVFSSVAGEYSAMRTGAVIADLGAQVRYAVRGSDAAAMLARLTTAPAIGLQSGESARGLILDQMGGVIDLAEVSRLSEDLYLLSSSSPHGRRMRLGADGLNVSYDEISRQVAALGVFGPRAREAAARAGVKLAQNGAATSGRVRGVETAVRNLQFGSTPALEMIFPKEEALIVWERMMRADNVRPIGLDALELLRIETGIPRPFVDFAPVGPGIQPFRPSELGLPHFAPLDRGWFNGRRGLRRSQDGPARRLCVVSIDADNAAIGAVIFDGDRPVGRVTSFAFSPAAKRVIAFAELTAAPAAEVLSCALPPPAGGRADLRPLTTHESTLAADFVASQKTTTESGFRSV